MIDFLMKEDWVVTLYLKVPAPGLSTNLFVAYSEALAKFFEHERIKECFDIHKTLFEFSDHGTFPVFMHVHLICEIADFFDECELKQIWRECAELDYDPFVLIQ